MLLHHSSDKPANINKAFLAVRLKTNPHIKLICQINDGLIQSIYMTMTPFEKKKLIQAPKPVL
jgi:polyribonucleotide nucleotidyltransferase